MDAGGMQVKSTGGDGRRFGGEVGEARCLINPELAPFFVSESSCETACKEIVSTSTIKLHRVVYFNNRHIGPSIAQPFPSQ